MLVSEGTTGETLTVPDLEQGPVSMDTVAEIGAQVAERFPDYETAGLASSWTGVYDVTPDWNPVLGRVPGVEGLVVVSASRGMGSSSRRRSVAFSRRRRSDLRRMCRLRRTRSSASSEATCSSASTAPERCPETSAI